MIIEAEADKHICCGAIGHPESNFHQHGMCEGSRCMAWRWREKGISVDTPSGLHPEYAGYRTHGYCGLAGKP